MGEVGLTSDWATPLLAVPSNLDSVNLIRFIGEQFRVGIHATFWGLLGANAIFQALHGRARLTAIGQSFSDLKNGKIMLARILGNRPVIAVAKLLAISLLVGLALTAFGVDPLHLAANLQWVMHRAANLGSGTLHGEAVAEPTRTATPSPGEGNQFPTEAQAKTRCRPDTVVWVNLGAKVYHFSGYKDYGTTKKGAYMCEKEATRQGFHAPKAEKHPA